MNPTFRFHAKVVGLIALLAAYMVLELSLNMTLVDIYAHSVTDIFGQQHQAARDIELYGRMITGAGLSLLILTLLPARLFKARESLPKIPLRYQPCLFKGLLFICLWALIMPSIRLLVDGVVYQSSRDDKLHAIRAVVFKEAYNNDMVKFSASEAMGEVIKSDEKRKLMIALVPTLAYLSPHFKWMIADKTDELALQFIGRRQKEDYIREARPRLQQNHALFAWEWQLYANAQKQAEEAVTKVANYNKLRHETEQWEGKSRDYLNQLWREYQYDFSSSSDYARTVAKRHAHEYGRLTGEFNRRSCDGNCKLGIFNEWRRLLDNTHIEWNGGYEAVEVDLGQRYQWFKEVEPSTTEAQLHMQLTAARERYLERRHGLAPGATREVYLNRRETQQMLVNWLGSRGIHVPSDWTLDDSRGLRTAVKAKYRNDEDAIWARYLRESKLKILARNLTQAQFAQAPALRNAYRDNLGEFYYPRYRLTDSEQVSYDAWFEGQNHLNFIHMITDSSSVFALDEGGSFYNIGLDAVKFAVIPSVSIVLSFIAVGALLLKLIGYLFALNARYYAIAAILGALVFVVIPLSNNLRDDESYLHLMTEFIENSQSDSLLDNTLARGFGLALDVEQFVYRLAEKVAVPLVDLSPTHQASTQPLASEVRRWDDWFHQSFEALPLWLARVQPGDPYDFNIAIFRKSATSGLYAGVRTDGVQVTQVSLPLLNHGQDYGALLDEEVKLQQSHEQSLREYLGLPSSSSQSILSTVEIEQRLVEVMNEHIRREENSVLTQAMGEAVNNLVLVQTREGRHYHCYFFPSLKFDVLVRGLNRDGMIAAKNTQCDGVL